MSETELTYKEKKDKVSEMQRISHTSCGNLSGHIKNTKSRITVGTIELSLDSDTAFALCNLLSDRALNEAGGHLEDDQKQKLISLGGALGRYVNHPSANNGNSAYYSG